MFALIDLFFLAIRVISDDGKVASFVDILTVSGWLGINDSVGDQAKQYEKESMGISLASSLSKLWLIVKLQMIALSSNLVAILLTRLLITTLSSVVKVADTSILSPFTCFWVTQQFVWKLFMPRAPVIL